MAGLRHLGRLAIERFNGVDDRPICLFALIYIAFGVPVVDLLPDDGSVARWLFGIVW